LARWGSPVGGALAEASAPDDRPERRSALAGRSFAPVVLGFSSIAGVVAAVLALLPAALGRGPTGRRAPAQHAAAEQSPLRR